MQTYHPGYLFVSPVRTTTKTSFELKQGKSKIIQYSRHENTSQRNLKAVITFLAPPYKSEKKAGFN